MKKDQKQKRRSKESIRIMPEFKYKPKGPKTTTTAILANQFKALPFEERVKFIEALGRTPEAARRDLNKKK